MPTHVRPPLYKSGDWEVDLAQRELRSRGVVAPLGSRAFEILEVLVQASGELVNKYDLVDRVWPGAVITENTLHVHVSAIRRALGGDRTMLKNVPGRGYRLLGTWRAQDAGPPRGATDPAAADDPAPRSPLTGLGSSPSRPTTNLPQPVSELIGRDDELQEVWNLSARQRLVTLTGTGGIGKTRLAFEVARRQLPQFPDGVWVSELAPLSDPDLVPVTVATVLGLDFAPGTASVKSVADALGAKHLMLVLDNCEHVIDAAAGLVESLLGACPALHVIATSREPLRINGEWVYRVPPLAVPEEDSRDGVAVLRYGAVRLFSERAHAAGMRPSPDVGMGASISRICRRLDGIPLAIELAAARAAAFGVEGVAAGLDDRLQLLAGGGPRSALPRHQTLRGTLDWSHELLTEPERVTLRRLAVFAGGFTLRAAQVILEDDTLPAGEITDHVATLVAKSLVATEAGGAVPRHRLLETTRAYALEQLARAGEADIVGARHARYYLKVLSLNPGTRQTVPIDATMEKHGAIIDNMRAALDWAFSPTGDVSLGVALATAAVPVLMHLSLVEECRRRAEQALAVVAAGAACDASYEMRLQVALATSLIFTRGAVPEARAAAAKALEAAERFGDIEYQSRSLWCLWLFNIVSGKPRDALSLARKSHALSATRSDSLDYRVCERMLGASHYYLGNLLDARRHFQRMLAQRVTRERNWQTPRFEGDEWVRARAYLARILWQQGFPDQAMRAVERCVAEAQATGHPVALTDALVMAACPIALWVADLATAGQYIEMLLTVSTQNALEHWRTFGRCYLAGLIIQQGQTEDGLRLLREVFEAYAGGSIIKFFSARLAEALWRAGEIAEGIAVIDAAIMSCQSREEHWASAEMLRIKGELLLSLGRAEARADAEGCFLRAIDLARRQGALSWELRAATSLARTLGHKTEKNAAYEFLLPIYNRFTEGFATADLKAAKSLIDELS